jgi:two-component system NarL family sensor kinase
MPERDQVAHGGSGMDASRQIALLRAVLDITTADLDVRSLAQQVAELLTGVAGSDVCFVHLVDEDRRCIVLAGATPPFDELAGTIELPLGEGVSGWVALHGRPAVVPDKWSDPRYRYLPALHGEDYSSLVSVPMVRRGTRVVGALNLHARRARHYDDGDVALLQDLANLVAGAVDNARLYQRLSQREEALARFAARTVEAQEAERRRLAGDIHDGISQRLVSLSYHLDAATSAVEGPERDTARVAAELSRARALVDAALDEARSAIRGLRPTVLDDLGLAAGLASLARGLGDVEVTVDVTSVDLAPHVETALYRIGQEALQNVAKHARASHVQVVLRAVGDEVTLTVHDDGAGFPATDAAPTGGGPSTGAGASFGLQGMAERIDLVGGRLTVESTPGQGTTVTATVPRQPA